MRIISHSIRCGAQTYAANVTSTIKQSKATATATATTVSNNKISNNNSATKSTVTQQTLTQATKTNIRRLIAHRQLSTEVALLTAPQLVYPSLLESSAFSPSGNTSNSSALPSPSSTPTSALLRRSYAAQFKMNCPILIVISLACILHASLLWNGVSAAISNRGEFLPIGIQLSALRRLLLMLVHSIY
ncbi:lateral signaling target protein 2 homolog [Ceratitis capitata]|uniref:lateral signaling target protein 2 homolog n=1 Tax=Ceratitis capitata TaxID=7213 RepID=UPI000C6C6C07|nr:lateral signaling target protein 2 homolog [Ceratitis capitata]